MKKLFTAVVLMLLSVTAFAQRPMAGMKSFQFGISGIDNINVNANYGTTGSLLFRYYLADDLAVRVGINLSTDSDKEEDTTGTVIAGGPFGNGSGVSEETKTSTTDFALQLGVQKALGTGEKLEPYIGADLHFGISNSKETENAEITDAALAGFANGDSYEFEDKSSSMYFGVVPVVGFNYYFTENFGVGAEFGWGFLLSSEGYGEGTETTNIAGTSTTTEFTTGPKSNNSGFGTISSGQVGVVVAF
jgi:hypothetical protein